MTRDYLKRLRKEKNITQKEAAEIMGISQQYYNFIENGTRQKDMSLSISIGLAQMFGVAHQYILEEERKRKDLRE